MPCVSQLLGNGLCNRSVLPLLDSLAPAPILFEAEGEACVYHPKLTVAFQDLRSLVTLEIEMRCYSRAR